MRAAVAWLVKTERSTSMPLNMLATVPLGKAGWDFGNGVGRHTSTVKSARLPLVSLERVLAVAAWGAHSTRLRTGVGGGPVGSAGTGMPHWDMAHWSGEYESGLMVTVW